MSDVVLTRALIARGVDHGEIRELTRTGRLQHLRRGAYAPVAERSAIDEHLLLVRAAAGLAESDSVVSFGSAAVLHGLPVSRHSIERVHLTRKRTDSGRIRPGLHVHVAPLTDADVIDVEGLQVTSLERTVVDYARSSTLWPAVAAGDVALQNGLLPTALDDQLRLAKNRRGIRTARRAASIIDERSESVAESYSRVLMIENGLPRPDLQVRIEGDRGFVARVDFLWEDVQVVGEFDGKIKYGRSLDPDEDPGEAVFREKIREDRLRELGYVVVRWIWDDLQHPERLVARIGRALDARGRRT